jgi:hypothetical protein
VRLRGGEASVAAAGISPRVHRKAGPLVPVDGRQAGTVVDMGRCRKETPGMASGEHNAAASAAGYLYQVRWALLNLVREGKTRPDQVISLEMLDDEDCRRFSRCEGREGMRRCPPGGATPWGATAPTKRRPAGAPRP